MNAQFQQKCQKDYLLSNYSNITVTLSTANTFSYEKKKVKLSQYHARSTLVFLYIDKRRYIGSMIDRQDESLSGIKTYILFGDTEIPELESLLQRYPNFVSPLKKVF